MEGLKSKYRSLNRQEKLALSRLRWISYILQHLLQDRQAWKEKEKERDIWSTFEQTRKSPCRMNVYGRRKHCGWGTWWLHTVYSSILHHQRHHFSLG